jgi:dTDP-4-dehydrorhamnose reductase
MKILLTGKDGQVGFELNRKLEKIYEIIATGRHELDLSNLENIEHFINKIKPDMIINTAAYTAVDKAEFEPDLAYKINVSAIEVMCGKARELNIPIIHFSTDYVFNGLKNRPYKEEDPTNPQSIYGMSKQEGEKAVRKCPKHIILRTSWVFSSHGHNFLKTILRLIQEKNPLKIVSDQRGSPTSSAMLADVTLKILNKMMEDKNFNDFGTYHVASDGDTTWHQYAIFISNEATRMGIHSKINSSDIKTILSADYLAPAARPLNSILNTEKIKKTFMLELPHWEDEVKKVLEDLIY